MPNDDKTQKTPANGTSKAASPVRATLPDAIQSNLDNEEKLWDVLYEGQAKDSTDSNARYAAYAARARTILRSAHRYVAYTSDIGESFRPVAHPWLIKGAYGVSWAYLAGDVSNEGYKAYIRNQNILNAHNDASAPVVQGVGSEIQKASKDAESAPKEAATSVAAAVKDLGSKTPQHIAPIDDYRTVMAQRAIFQGVASMGLPAFTIHSIVKYSGRALKNNSNVRIRSYGPIGLGLAAVPFLPFIFDKPVEEAVEWTFHKGFSMAGGKHAVEDVSGKKEL